MSDTVATVLILFALQIKKPEFMEQKILNYSISLAFCLLLSLPLQAQNSDISAPPANTPPKKEKKEAKEEVHYPLYNGISVSVDLWGPGSKLFGSDFFSSEVAVDVNLKNRFFPIVELGYGNTDTWSDKGIHYKTGAPYFVSVWTITRFITKNTDI